MMILGFASWLGITLLTGYAAVWVVWPAAEERRLSELTLRLALAIGAGLGIGSCTMFLAMVAVGPSLFPILLIDALVLAVLVIVALRRRHSQQDRIAFPRPADPSPIERLIAWAMLALLGVAILGTLALTLKMRNGLWDAWGIYNLAARFMYLGGEAWRRAFTVGVGLHPDYPLLLPGSVVRGWIYVGRDTTVVPALTAALYTYATIGLLAGAIWVLRGRRHAALVGVVALGTPFLLTQGASQYADLPLVFYMLAAIVLLTLADRADSGATWLLVASGFSAGLAAWTKNEGLLYVLILSFGVLVIHRHFVRQRDARRSLASFLVGLVPVLAIEAYFKIVLAPPNDLVSGQGSGTLPRILDVHRYWTIISSVIHAAPIVPVIPVALFLALVGVDRRGRDLRAVMLACFAVAALAAGYFAVYVITPLDLTVQIGRSLTRLILQLWPLLLFIVFMVSRIPERPLDSAK